MPSQFLPISPQEIGDYAASLFGSNIREIERASVILAVAALETSLENSLRKLLADDPRVGAEVFRPDGPLGSLKAKISIARLVGLVDPAAAQALNLARRIRNDFAHQTDQATLDRPPHCHRAAELEKLTHIETMLPMFDEWIRAAPASRRQIGFCVAIAALTKLLEKCAAFNTHTPPPARVRLALQPQEPPS